MKKSPYTPISKANTVVAGSYSWELNSRLGLPPATWYCTFFFSLLLISNDTPGHLVPLGWGSWIHDRNGTSSCVCVRVKGGEGKERLERHATWQDDIRKTLKKETSNFVEERKTKPNYSSSAFKAQRAKKRCKNIYLYIYIEF